MKKILFALVATAATLAGTSAYAADLGDDAGSAYVGVGVLGSRYKFDVPNASSSSSNSGTKAGGKIYAGYNIDKTWAVEGGYTNFGKQDYDYTVNGAPGRLESDAHSFYVAGKGTWPVNEQVSLFGKLGVARNHNSVATSGIAAVSGDANKSALYASVGAEYAISKQVKVSLEYENYGKNNIDMGRKNGAITAGVRYNF